MIHFIYKTTHKNGKYYVGRHSTSNINDGYIGSGNWPRSIKNRTDVTREILEYAEDTDSLIELEQRYLSENVGKPNCMNVAIGSVGWTSEDNPMKNPEIAATLSGDNHWTRRDPDKIVRGDKHWMNRDPEALAAFLEHHPNKDGRNAKLAMKRGTHINLGENNPAKQWSREGTHPWRTREDGTAIGGLTNTKRIEEGTHNWLGPEHNKRMIDAGIHNLLGPAANNAMLATGKHPSQIKKQCTYCDKIVSSGMYSRWHGDKCKHNK
jgi:hypothetical protein